MLGGTLDGETVELRPGVPAAPDAPTVGVPAPSPYDPDQTLAGGSAPFPFTGADAEPTGAPTAARAGVSGTRPAAGPLAPGQAFGPRYHIIKLLGVGGMGAVYQAWDAELGVAVAVKTVRPEASLDPEAARDVERRFKRELLLARQVTHKNVVRIHDLGEIDGVKYITMPYVEGADLSDVLKTEGKLPVPRALAIARQVASGLHAAHEVGVVHRDLKPANIMIEDDRALIMDFGIARSVVGPAEQTAGTGRLAAPGQGLSGSRADAAMATMVGSVVGTVDYMAPEQAKAQPADQRADIYAFGLIFRDLLLGSRPKSGNPVADLMARIQEGLPPPRSLDPAIPEEVDRLITRCLELDPDARFATSAELVEALDRLDADGQLLPEPASLLTRRRVVGAAVIVLALLTGTWWIGRQSAPVAPEQHEPVSVLITDVLNSTGDPVFDGAIEQVLGLGVEGASFITAYSRPAAQRLVNQLSPGKRLDEANARLVAVSAGIKVILASAIQPAGSGYRIEVKAIDPAAAEPLTVVNGSARDKASVLGTIQDLASEIRTELGDTTPESAREQARETFTAASLDAVRAYQQAQNLAAERREREATVLYQEALKYDPDFGRAYASWATAAYRLGEREQAEELWKKAMSLMDRMTERERFRTLGNYYLGITRNYEVAIENYTALLERYPADNAGLNSIAVAYFETLDLQKAVEYGERAARLYPKNGLYRTNLALYAMYAGNFEVAVREADEALAISPAFEKAYLAKAIAAIAASKPDEARQIYEQMSKANARGAALAPIGLADLAMYEGRYAEAEAVLEGSLSSLSETAAAGSPRDRAMTQVVLGEARLATGRTAQAVQTLEAALETDRGNTAVASARLLLEAGREKEAVELADGLERQIQKRSRAYGKLIKAEIALAQGRATDAVDLLMEARALTDLWLVRFALGRAYEEAGYHAEALSELVACQQRMGEATSVFLDDVPSYRFLVPLSYWRARAQAGVGMTEAATDNFNAYLALRGGVPDDPLAADARRRLAKQP